MRITAAVIAEARRRQRRRRRFAALALLLIVGGGFLAHHLGSGHGASTAPGNRSTQPTTVRVFLQSDITAVRKLQTLAAVRVTPGATGVHFVSKSAGLKALRRRYPALTAGLKANPLLNEIDIRVQPGVSAKRIASQLRTLHLPISVIQIRDAPK